MDREVIENIRQLCLRLGEKKGAQLEYFCFADDICLDDGGAGGQRGWTPKIQKWDIRISIGIWCNPIDLNEIKQFFGGKNEKKILLSLISIFKYAFLYCKFSKKLKLRAKTFN